jgi:hypothetical protein
MTIFRDTRCKVVFQQMVGVLTAPVLVVVSNSAFAMSGFELKQKADAYERSGASDFDFIKNPTDPANGPYSMGYVDGITDAVHDRSICVPTSVANGQPSRATIW